MLAFSNSSAAYARRRTFGTAFARIPRRHYRRGPWRRCHRGWLPVVSETSGATAIMFYSCVHVLFASILFMYVEVYSRFVDSLIYILSLYI